MKRKASNRVQKEKRRALTRQHEPPIGGVVCMSILKYNIENLSCQHSNETTVLNEGSERVSPRSGDDEKLFLPLHQRVSLIPAHGVIGIPQAKYIAVMGMLAKEQIEKLMRQLTPRDIGALMESLRRRVRKVCIECGKEFTGYVHQKYCSKRCQHRRHMREYMRRRRVTQIEQKRSSRGNPAAEGGDAE